MEKSLSLDDMKRIGENFRNFFLNSEPDEALKALKDDYKTYAPGSRFPSWKNPKEKINNGELKIPLPFFMPGIIFKIDDVNNYFARLALQKVTIRDFIWLLAKKVNWTNVTSDRLKHFQFVVEETSKKLNDERDNDQLFKDYPKIECDASKILANIGKYTILKEEEEYDKTKDIYELINLCDDIFDVDKIDAKPGNPLLRPILKNLGPTKGFGLFALKNYNPGEFVAEYGGIILEGVDRTPYSADPFVPGTPEDYKKTWYVDATYGWTLEERGRFVNHTSEPGADNCAFEAVQPTKVNENGEIVFEELPPLNDKKELKTFLEKSHLKVVAIRRINVGDELLINYGWDYPFYADTWIKGWDPALPKDEKKRLIPPSIPSEQQKIEKNFAILDKKEFDYEDGHVYYDPGAKEYLFRRDPNKAKDV